jgi:hypothetical protein
VVNTEEKTQSAVIPISNHQQAWEIVLGQLREEMTRSQYEQWVLPLRPLIYENGTFVLGTYNAYTREWVEARLGNRLIQLLEGIYGSAIALQVIVDNDLGSSIKKGIPAIEAESNTWLSSQPEEDIKADKLPETSSRKIMLQRAYGNERARLIQPERGMFVTLYFMFQWLPLIGHSAMAVIFAARSMCYWNPKTGELRNKIETDMSELAERASVSVRTVKDVLNNELVKKYFIRYVVRRMMTPNGIRTAGILLQVRMDDPLTPKDQEENNLSENEVWYSIEFDDEKD